MLTELELRKLKYFKERYGEMSASEALEAAEFAEAILSDLANNPLDPAHQKFREDRESMLIYASLLDEAAATK